MSYQWMKMGRLVSLEGLALVEALVPLYRRAIFTVMALAALLAFVGIGANHLGFYSVNWIFLVATFVAWVYVSLHPKPLAIILALGGIRGLPDNELSEIIKKLQFANFSLNEVAKSGLEMLKTWEQGLALAFLTPMALFIVLIIVPMVDPKGALLAVAILCAIGTWSVARGGSAKVYMKVTGAIIGIGFLLAILQATGVVSWASAGVKVASGKEYIRQMELSLVKPQRVTWKVLPEGCYSWKVREAYVFMNNAPLEQAALKGRTLLDSRDENEPYCSDG